MPAAALDLKQDIVSYAESLGFGRVGITSADRLASAEKALGDWIADGRAGDMDYMEKGWERRARPEELLPGAKSMIVLAMNYYSDAPAAGLPGEGKVARYAWGKDYHKVIEKRLASLVRYIEALAPGVRCKTYNDTGPLLERALAQRAGLGFIGKNTMLITRGLGSWVFLAGVLTTLDLPLEGPDTRSCGSCTLCIDACPTQAITEPYQLDARRCISYLTIEDKNVHPGADRVDTGDWLFGCDICQDVCPHNTRIPATPIEEFKPAPGGSEIRLSDILALKDEADFNRKFSGTALKRPGRHGLIRNACRAAANQNRIDLLPQLQTLATEDPHRVVREHASGAVRRLSPHGSLV